MPDLSEDLCVGEELSELSQLNADACSIVSILVEPVGAPALPAHMFCEGTAQEDSPVPVH